MTSLIVRSADISANVASILRHAAETWPDRPAVVDLADGGSRHVVTYAELDRRASGIATALDALGLRAGDRVAFLMTNSTTYLEVYFGCAAAGLVVVPMNTRLLADEHLHMVRDSGARLLVADEALLDDRRELADIPELGCVTVDATGHHSLDYTAEHHPRWPLDLDGETLLSLMYTSGTTGAPKGVMLSHRSWRSVAELTRRILRFDDDEVVLHSAPLTHGSGFLVLPAMEVGGANVLMRGFSADAVLRAFEHERVTSGFFVPTMIRMLLDHLGTDRTPVHHLRSMYYAGAPIDAGTMTEALDRFGPVLVQSFGQMETPMYLTVLSHEEHEAIARGERPELIGTAGRALDDVQLRIVDDEGNEVAPGEAGEIIAISPQMMLGYWNRPDATADTIVDGWLHTGDVARTDDGYVSIVDRKKDMIITGGSNVYAREVEEVLLEVDGVREAAVVGVPHPTWGEAVTAVLVREDGATVTSDDVMRLARERLADYRRPKSVVWLDALPRNSYGKVLKRDLRAGLQAAARDDAS